MKQRMDVRFATRIALAAALSATWAGAAYADESTEQDLRREVEDLRRELAELKDTVRGGYFTASSDLEARVGELEKLAGDASFASTFKNGMRSETADGSFRYQVGGWFQNDWGWFPDENGSDDYGDLEGGTNFNAARLYVMGQIYGNVAFKTEYDFSADEGEFKDVWMEIRNCSFGALRIGHMKEPIGLETLTDDKYYTFMNRNATHSLMPNRNTGLMVHGTCADDSLLYQVGMFRTTENDHGSDFGSYSTSQAFTGRISGRPFVKDDGASYLHLGVGGSWRDEDESTTISYKPLGSFVALPSASADAEDLWIAEAEAAFVAGAFIAKAEYAHIDVDTGAGTSDAEADAWSVEAGFWLTGEQWSYAKDSGAFSRPTVKKNFGDEKGMGAFQVAGRWDNIDPDVDGVDDDDVDTYTVGLNWFLNPNTRVSLNWTRVNPEGDLESLDWIGLRFQIDF